MKKYLNTGIKQVIEKFPELAPILKEYDINCATCNGNCLLKDIFEEHSLSMKQEMELKQRMSMVISGAEQVKESLAV
jgi:iron-sulfur cluster repair protein YtfE (RIC family)